MPGRHSGSTRALAALLAAAALAGGCRDNATTGPSHVQPNDFAAALRSVGGDQQTGAVGAALGQQVVVKVVDANGLPVQGANVTFSVRAGGGSTNPAGGTSSAAGEVATTWTLGTTLGANRVVAVLTNGFVLDSAVFTATAQPGAPTIMTISGGNAQTGRVAARLAQNLTVRVADQYGYTRSGVRVTWSAGAGSGSLSFTTDTTAADGTATAAWTLGTTIVPQSASASVAGVPPVNFFATALPDTSRRLTVVSGSGQVGEVAAALGATLRMRVTDVYGNGISGESVNWVDSVAGGGTVSVQVGTTAVDGSTQTTWTLGNRAGPQFLRAKHGASGSVATFTATATVGFSEVVAGTFQACGVAASNQRIYCWGAGDAGQLAKGVLVNASAPTTAASTTTDTLVGPFLQVRQLAGGRDSFCGLTPARQMFCWGRVIEGASAVVNTATFQAIVTGSTNQQILVNFIALGQEHVCLMDLAGVPFCSGVNFHGQLGDGTNVTPNINTYVFTLPFNDLYSTISAGRSHNCGLPRFNPASATSQVPRCWGLNNTGQVGNGTLTFADVLTPTSITMPAGVTAFDSVSITAGAQHSCAFTPAGVAYCWGNNAFGQLGKGGAPTAASRDSVPQAVSAPAGVAFARLYAGEFHTCGISTAGDAYCWGRNDYGQLGDGSRVNQSAPIAVGGGLKFRSLSLGELFTCGVVAALGTPGVTSSTPGTVYCWGDNIFGQLGNGAASANNPVMAPTRVLYQP